LNERKIGQRNKFSVCCRVLHLKEIVHRKSSNWDYEFVGFFFQIATSNQKEKKKQHQTERNCKKANELREKIKLKERIQFPIHFNMK